MHIVELLTPYQEAAWLPWAVQYFFLVGIAAASALLVAACAFAAPGTQRAALLPAACAVLAVSALAAPVSLLADLHQPGRFLHFYAHLTPWSWMSLGAILLPVFVGLALAACGAWCLGRLRLLRALALPLALAALAVLVYSGAEVMVIRSRPLWHTIFLPLNFALTGWLAALGAMLVLARWLPGGLAALPVGLVRRLAWGGLLAGSACALAWAAAGSAGHDPAFDAALRLYRQFPAWRLAFLGSVGAAVAIMALLACGEARLARPAMALLTGAALLAAGWVFRWIVFMGVQEVPKYGAGLYLYQMPLGGNGLLGMLGVLGLCVALVALVTWLIPVARSGAPAPTR